MDKSPAPNKGHSWLRVLYRFPGLLMLLRRLLCRAQFFWLRMYKEPAEAAFITSIYRKVDCLLQPMELYTLWSLAKMQARLPGDMAELGLYQGASAKVMCEEKGDKHFFGFDTFDGLPTVGTEDGYDEGAFFHKGQFFSDADKSRCFLSQYANVHFIKGVFPASAEGREELRGRTFCLVHLDADLYEGTKAGLEYFWERLVDRGAIVVHDSNAKGVRRALTEFFTKHHPPTFEMYSSQCVIFKG